MDVCVRGDGEVQLGRQGEMGRRDDGLGRNRTADRRLGRVALNHLRRSLTADCLSHGHKLFCHGRVNTNCGIKYCFSRASLERYGYSLDNFAGLRT